MLTLGFLDLGRTAHVGPRFIYLKKGTELAYGIDDPVLTKRLELLHSFEGCDCSQWYPVIIVGGVEAPHEPEGPLEE